MSAYKGISTDDETYLVDLTLGVGLNHSLINTQTSHSSRAHRSVRSCISHQTWRTRMRALELEVVVPVGTVKAVHHWLEGVDLYFINGGCAGAGDKTFRRSHGETSTSIMLGSEVIGRVPGMGRTWFLRRMQPHYQRQK